MKRVKKIILMAATLVAVVGMSLVSDKVAYADGNKTVNIHYFRDDAKYSDYVITVWDEYNQGTDYEIKVSGNEGVVNYTCSSSESTVVNFVVKPKNDSIPSEYNKNRTIDVEEIAVNSVDVYVKSGVENISTKGYDELGGIETTVTETIVSETTASETTVAETTAGETTTDETATEETTVAETIAEETTAAEADLKEAVTEVSNTVATDNNAKDKDYSVGTATVIVVDIISILILAAVSFLICNKKEQ